MRPNDLHVEVGQPGGDPEGHARHLGLLHRVLQRVSLFEYLRKIKNCIIIHNFWMLKKLQHGTEPQLTCPER